GERLAPLAGVHCAGPDYGTAAPVPRRRTAKMRLMTARISRMWIHAPIDAPETSPRTQRTSRMTVIVQSMTPPFPAKVGAAPTARNGRAAAAFVRGGRRAIVLPGAAASHPAALACHPSERASVESACPPIHAARL